MSARNVTATGVIGGLIGFIAMSVVAGLLVAAAVTPAVAVTGMAANNSIGVFEGLPEYIKIDPLATRSTMYATKNGKPQAIATFYSQNRIIDKWDQVNQIVKDAAVSAEDPRFYEHGGIDLEGTARAIAVTYLGGSGDVQGGSSITQQYVKNVRLQTCEKYNVLVDGTGDAQKKAQAEMDKKYQDCYDEYTQQTPARKVQEMKLAIGLEKKYTKREILLGYLNIAGFGGQIYGIESAARYYFDTTAAKLTLAQAATLVGIVNNPNKLRIDLTDKESPDNGPKSGYKLAKQRRDYVLSSMLKNKKISKAQYEAAVKTPIKPKITPQPSGCAQAAKYDAAFYCQAVINELQSNTVFGKTQDDRDELLNHGGLKIYTALNLDLQSSAQANLSAYIPATRAGMDLGAADVSVEVGTGRVVMAVQNRPYNTTNTLQSDSTTVAYPFDYQHGGSAGFQTGSSYKTFSLIEWLKEGHALNDYVNAPTGTVTIPQSNYHASCQSGPFAGTWTLGNDTAGEGGRMTVLTATKESVNTAYAVMGEQLDMCGIRDVAKSLGVKPAYPYEREYNSAGQLVIVKDDNGKPVPSQLNYQPASILGTNYIAPVDMAVAYAGIANKGKTCSPIYIDKIVDANNKSLAVPKSTCTQAIDPKIAATVAYALKTPFQAGGTAQAANPGDGVPIMGKTGTSDNSEENWLVSSTTKVANAVWVGNVSGNVGFQSLTWPGPNQGRNVKFSVVKPILQELNRVYGGSEFPAPDDKLTNGEQIPVPDLSGKTVSEAKSILSGLGFTYQDGGEKDSSVEKGKVAGTNPGAGSKASKGSVVQVYTSKGNLVKVPNVVGKSVADATKTLLAAGFHVKVSGSTSGTVSAQSPGADSEAKEGAEVTITVKAAAKSSGDGDSGGSSPAPGGGGHGHH
ncbi:transglycosylase domain-containing protein [Gryllotalpicola ginsengisoli]|uniref:transglycosylase domain-containing protein n=1 Tax=Gryllotalpicola ginsengisoli TaxID=444608 RepID=UPI00040C0B0C|nr:transglycosylase domain-containing protein [Gryllotalpicola ginsengisoli]